MDKTIEEMEKAVLAYCEEVCPQIKNEYFPLGATDDGARALYLRKSATFFNDPKTAYHVLCCKGQEHVLSKETLASASDETVMLFYRLLGLSERDAVAELQSRNTALVVALDELTNGIGNVQFMYNSYLQYKDSANAFNLSRSIGELVRAKAKFKNELLALSANTEKGGGDA